LFNVRVRERSELAPPEDTRLVVAQLARFTAALASVSVSSNASPQPTPSSSSSSSAAGSSNSLEALIPWYDNFDFLDRLRRVILHDLDALAGTAEVKKEGGLDDWLTGCSNAAAADDDDD
jgi:hypothetical protein